MQSSLGGVMHLVQILLPVTEPAKEFRAILQAVESELTERFGGVTSYARAPARGLWAGGTAGPERDDVVVVEVMVAELDLPWGHALRARLERLLHQEQILLRSMPVETI